MALYSTIVTNYKKPENRVTINLKRVSVKSSFSKKVVKNYSEKVQVVAAHKKYSLSQNQSINLSVALGEM